MYAYASLIIERNNATQQEMAKHKARVAQLKGRLKMQQNSTITVCEASINSLINSTSFFLLLFLHQHGRLHVLLPDHLLDFSESKKISLDQRRYSVFTKLVEVCHAVYTDRLGIIKRVTE